jgi:hypothetical protein
MRSVKTKEKKLEQIRAVMFITPVCGQIGSRVGKGQRGKFYSAKAILIVKEQNERYHKTDSLTLHSK